MSLLSECTSGGCGAKIGPGELSAILSKIPKFNNENLIVGFDGSDDAAIYNYNGTQIVSTVDFFSPMIEDPFLFGKIAAANSLSDVYSMGGRPLFALNLVCFPEKLDKSILGDILAGGAEKLMEAGAVLAGGHSIYDKEIKYGLAVTGVMEGRKPLLNNTCEEGDTLILTKPLGVGIILSAHRGNLASESAVMSACMSMERLNKYAAESVQEFEVHSCTDVTGFGLLAHSCEMLSDRFTAELKPNKIPFFPEAYRYAEEYLLTAAGQRNREYFGDKAELCIPFPMQELLFDPQTSGGLLLSVAGKDAEEALSAIQKSEPKASIIGKIIKKQQKSVIFS